MAFSAEPGQDQRGTAPGEPEEPEESEKSEESEESEAGEADEGPAGGRRPVPALTTPPRL
ncbi:hypothetical protein [Streptomyces sp. PSAA01]|uniref:hypothetical protein n=1 Tax=Streptomyces sp. PSAA01 TaxID=2912762 RepID=UPI001F3AFDBC|nr:hypothetical protein [Streptomyces sp. PSAA01]MCG0290376.1 hypothetical protein [Streptomyces sp. PSAA01]